MVLFLGLLGLAATTTFSSNNPLLSLGSGGGGGLLLRPVEALAAAKNKRRGQKGKGGGGGAFGGFGKPPPTLDDVLSNVRFTRFPAENGPSLPCPCGAKRSQNPTELQTYGECCQPLLDKTSNNDGGCTTPLEVLQSRYTAFCYRDIGHVIRTTHEECRDYRDDKVAWAKDLDKEGMFDSFEFVGLEVVEEEDEEDSETNDGDDTNEAFVEFRVRLRGRPLDEAPARSRSAASIEGEETIVSERSRFLRDPSTGFWKYAGGDVRSTVEGLEDTSLNNA